MPRSAPPHWCQATLLESRSFGFAWLSGNLWSRRHYVQRNCLEARRSFLRADARCQGKLSGLHLHIQIDPCCWLSWYRSLSRWFTPQIHHESSTFISHHSEHRVVRVLVGRSSVQHLAVVVVLQRLLVRKNHVLPILNRFRAVVVDELQALCQVILVEQNGQLGNMALEIISV